MTSSSSQLASPEKRLLVACARTTAEPPVVDEIRELSAAALDWEFVVNESAVNSILPLVARNISAVAAQIAPAKHVERLTKGARANALRCLSLTAELIRIVDLLRAAGVQAMPYKGPLLAVDAYGDVTLREFEDLDIIVRQQDMAKADEVVQKLGYRPNHPWTFAARATSPVVPGEYDYRDEARGMIVEFHTEFTLRHFPVRPDLGEMSKRLVSVAVSGHEIPTFCPEDMLSLLCVHGAKDFWERISWIADVAEFLRSHPRLNWDLVLSRAESLQVGRMLNLGLALATGMLGALLPAQISARVRRDSVAGDLASEIAQRHRIRAAPERGAGERFRYRRRMVAGGFAGWRYSVRLTTQPADEDSAAIGLPRALSPFYVLLRPLRLLRQYRAGSGGSEHGS
ncbi:MAG: nucleotidyltransferase family protein [Candidatus Acidiferrales bacterium]